MTKEEYVIELAKIEKMQKELVDIEGSFPLWLRMLGFADCETEKKLLKEEYNRGEHNWEKNTSSIKPSTHFWVEEL